jgi:hypothetical protein
LHYLPFHCGKKFTPEHSEETEKKGEIQNDEWGELPLALAGG